MIRARKRIRKSQPSVTLAEACDRIGGLIWVETRPEGWYVEATIKDVKVAYGRTDYLVVPTLGGPTLWVSGARCLLNPPKYSEEE